MKNKDKEYVEVIQQLFGISRKRLLVEKVKVNIIYAKLSRKKLTSGCQTWASEMWKFNHGTDLIVNTRFNLDDKLSKW